MRMSYSAVIPVQTVSVKHTTKSLRMGSFRPTQGTKQAKRRWSYDLSVECAGRAKRRPAPYTHLQSRRDCVLQPGVARNERGGGSNPERVAPLTGTTSCHNPCPGD